MARKEKNFYGLRRYGLAFGLGGLAALSLLWVMQFLIASGEAAATEDKSTHFVDFVRLEPPDYPDPPDDPPEPPSPPENPPPPVQPGHVDEPGGLVVDWLPGPPVVPETDGDPTSEMGFAGELLPLVRAQPVYPPQALRLGLEGYCDLEFTVTQVGNTADVRVTHCTSSLFEQSSIRALSKFKYQPRVVDGSPVAVSGMLVRLTFEIRD